MSSIYKIRGTKSSLAWLVLIGLIFGLNLKLVTNGTHAQTPEQTPGQNQSPDTKLTQESKEKIAFDDLAIVFKKKADLLTIDQESIIPNTLYYSNAYDDPSSMPTIKTNEGFSSLAIDSLKGFPSQREDTVYVLNQWIELPQEKLGLKELTIKFKSKLTKDPNFQWARTKGPSKTKAARKNELEIPRPNDTNNNLNTPTITLSIQSSPSYLSANSSSGPNIDNMDSVIIAMPPANAEKSPQWQDNTKTLTIRTNPTEPTKSTEPNQSQYLHIKLTTLAGYTLWLGDLELNYKE